ncbi:Asparaginyl-tRNA synthetase [Candidatus Syntrophocurvum alkaliphilum]|uniref:Asparagine--tRNA ligase n=1 Tax=Candidatus Syntrophocurvum alkaliphilum TaxID=2293317 RepID=A0A6I6DHV8_9FIRM|nr:asparagine--tRNA ligase [Candidatus Syntrophocurvum alkaliphilum]QGU00663.1 Asparaginyl-tRNA synthetase [Candidatus Syntrophocurvum alkaliphilum]
MEKTVIRQLVRDIKRYADKEVEISGWIRNNRDQKSFGFINLNDGTHFNTIQIVYERDLLSNYDEVARFRVGAAVTVRGIVVETPEAKQPFEIKAKEVNLEGDSPENYPIQPKRHTREFLREVAHLRPRTNLFSAVFRVRSLASYATHKFFNEKGFVYVHSPIITASDAEGAGEMFRITTLDPKNPPVTEEKEVDFKEDFFGKKTNLTVSGQLEAESFALAFRDVYTFGPTFRAENSNTARHAAEFWMIEPEIAFADLEDDMRLAEEMVKYLINYLLENAKEEMDFFNQFVDKGLKERLENIVKSEFVKITYTEAIEKLKQSGEKFEYPVDWGSDLQTEHERYLTEKIYKKPVFVTDYPKDIKAFYMRLNDDGKTVAAMDLLVPGVGELIGGSQREDRVELLEKRMEEMDIDKEELWWYLDLRKYGGVKHAGFGLGFERFIMYVTGVSNIRDVIPFPRTVNYCEF